MNIQQGIALLMENMSAEEIAEALKSVKKDESIKELVILLLQK